VFNGEEHEIDSRTSDALALAIRFGCPIYIYSNILEASGILLMEAPENEQVQRVQETSPEKFSAETNYNIYTLKELDKLLKDALAEESYEKAAAIRDELNKRGK
jgi:hypothetical protein